MGIEHAAQLLAVLGGAAVLVTGLTQPAKQLVFPTAWQTGRAPMILSAALALLAVVGATVQLGFSLTEPATVYAMATAWLEVYGLSIGTHQTVAKAGRVIAGTTNRAGADEGAP